MALKLPTLILKILLLINRHRAGQKTWETLRHSEENLKYYILQFLLHHKIC